MSKKNRGKKGKPKTPAQKAQSKISKINRRIIRRSETLSRVIKESGGNPRSVKELADSGKRLGKHRGYR